MLRSKPPHMEDDLLAVGRWTDDGVLDQSRATRPRREETKGYWQRPSAEPHRRQSRASKADYAGIGWENYYNRLYKLEDELLDTPPRKAIKEVRAAQLIQRQHPACFVKTEGGQQGNEATAKPPGTLSRAERYLINYLPLDEHEEKFRPVYWTRG